MHEILVIYATITNQSEITAFPVRCKIDFLILEKLKIQFRYSYKRRFSDLFLFFRERLKMRTVGYIRPFISSLFAFQSSDLPMALFIQLV